MGSDIFFCIGMIAALVTIMTCLLVDGMNRGLVQLWQFMMMALTIIYGVFLITKMIIIALAGA